MNINSAMKTAITLQLALTIAACGSTGTTTKETAASTVKESITQLSDYKTAASQSNVIFELPTWQKTTADIESTVTSSIAAGDSALDAIAAMPQDKLNFRNTIAALDSAYYPVINTTSRIDVIQETSPDKAMRDAALEANKKLQAWFVDASFRDDVYQVIQAYADTKPELEGEDAMLFKEVMREYRRNGMNLPAEKREQIQALKTELNNMGLEFAKNINEADAKEEFTAEDLNGVTEDFLNNKEVKTDKGNYEVDSNVTWQYLEVMKNAVKPATRQRLLMARYSRAMEDNIPLFTKMLKTRSKIASLLGYDSWADYRIEPKMAKNAKTAYEFEKNLVNGLDPKFKAEQEVLRQLKVAETGNTDASVELADVRYYTNKLKKDKYSVDTEKLKVFFELDRTLNGMFGIFEEGFGLDISEVEPDYQWVDGLRLFSVADAATKAPLGLIYMDLFPREGKYNHFAQFGITTGKLLDNGKYQRPVVALICNFQPATETKPSLMSHDHVETLFHEFGHALHSVLTQAKYASFSGTSVPRDFVEAPSQMLENWVWDKTVLDRFAADYRDESKKIPAEILDKMEEARLATVATHYRRQLGFGVLDLELHMSNDEDKFDHFAKVTNTIMGETYMPVPEGSAFVASFGHLGGGYDAGYYGYAWADAISADMAEVFESSPGRYMDTTVGRRLRDEIYAPGGSREIDESIHAFLMRERSLEPFFTKIGLEK